MTSRRSPFLSIGENLTKQRFINPYATVQDNNILKKRYLIEDLPLKIGDCKAWYDTQDYSTLTFNGNFVSKVDDKSGNSNDLIQATAIRQPLYVKNSAINNRPSLYLDGINDYMTSDSLSAFTAQKHTLFMVYRKESTAISALYAFNSIDGGGASTNSDVLLDLYNVASNIRWFGVGGAATNFFTGNYTYQNLIFSLINTNSSNNQEPYLNGVPGTTSSVSLSSSNRFSIGQEYDGGPVPSDFLEGYFGEFIFFNKQLTNEEVRNIENYLSFKWGI